MSKFCSSCDRCERALLKVSDTGVRKLCIYLRPPPHAAQAIPHTALVVYYLSTPDADTELA